MSEADAATQWLVNEIADYYLTPSQKARINRRFTSPDVHKNRLVLWTGENYDLVQKIARDHNKQTLSIALGPLIDPCHPEFAPSTSSRAAKAKFMHGASALFAQHISNHSSEVFLLCPPPPVMFNPNGRTYYQDIEEPIITKFGVNKNLRIFAVHPSVEGASNFPYEIWPTDRTCEWHQRFPGACVKKKKWRQTKPLTWLEDLDAVKRRFGLGGNIVAVDSGAPGGAGRKKKKKKKKKKNNNNNGAELLEGLANAMRALGRFVDGRQT